MNFATMKGLTIPEGVVTQITDASGRVLWALSGGKVILEVKKITSNTYANSTTYSNEEFILLDIYPKVANSTVKVTYGGLTKTLTFDSTYAQMVYFGTFNGVADSMTTPASGLLTIEGRCAAVSISSYNVKKSSTDYCKCVTAVNDLGNVTSIPNYAFYYCSFISHITIPEGVTRVGTSAFEGCYRIETFTIPSTVTSIGGNAFNIGLDHGAKTYIMKPTIPPTLEDPAWYGDDQIQAIIVPVGCAEAYKTAKYWSYHADKIVEVS